MNTCLCGCNKEVRNKFVRGHNSRVKEYSGGQWTNKNNPYIQGIVPTTPWCKGLTKETDIRLLEAGKKISRSLTGKTTPEITRKKQSLKAIGRKQSQSTIIKRILSNTGKKRTQKSKENMSNGQIKRYLNEPPEEKLLRIEKAKRRMEDPNFRKRIFTRKNISKEEFKLHCLIMDSELPFEYVGNFEEWVGTKCPDFINKKDKKIIELYGNYWHKNDNPQDRIDYFKQFDYECIVIWASELKNLNLVKDKIISFSKSEVI